MWVCSFRRFGYERQVMPKEQKKKRKRTLASAAPGTASGAVTSSQTAPQVRMCCLPAICNASWAEMVHALVTMTSRVLGQDVYSPTGEHVAGCGHEHTFHEYMGCD